MSLPKIIITAKSLNRNTQILSLSGKLDALTATEFLQRIQGLVESGINQLIFDLKELTLISSPGIGAFISIQQLTEKNKGSIRLANMNKSISQVFSLLSFDKFFPIDEDAESSRKALGL